MIKYLSTNNKKYNFIIRPHLVENNQTYIDIFKNYKNIYVDNNISVADHLDNTKCVIHTGCTTAAEAYFSKVPSIIFIPNKQYLNAIPDILKK